MLCAFGDVKGKEPVSPNNDPFKNWGAVEKPIFGDQDPFIFGLILGPKYFFINKHTTST